MLGKIIFRNEFTGLGTILTEEYKAVNYFLKDFDAVARTSVEFDINDETNMATNIVKI